MEVEESVIGVSVNTSLPNAFKIIFLIFQFLIVCLLMTPSCYV